MTPWLYRLLSAQAVRDVVDHAIDVSAAMLRAAERYSHVCYLVAAAERILLGDASADLATVGGAFHWFDQPSAFPVTEPWSAATASRPG